MNIFQSIFNIINVPLGYILEFIANILGGNFAASVFVFTLIINLVMIPLSIKSQKSSVQQTRMKPKLDALKKKYGDDRQRYSEEMQKLYQSEGVSMSGGCLPLLIRLPIMMSIYYLITQPLTYLLHIDSGVISAAAEKLGKMTTGSELKIIQAITNGEISNPDILSKLSKFDFKLFGIDLTETPKFSFDIFSSDDGFKPIWLIPIMAFLAQMLTSVISLIIQKKINPDAPNMAGMMLTMPLISLFIGFSLPGGVGFYWICSSLIGGLIQAGVQMFYGPFRMLSRQRTKELVKQCDFESKQIEKISNTNQEEE